MQVMVYNGPKTVILVFFLHCSCVYVQYTEKGKGSPYLITEHRVPELIPVLGSQPAVDVNHKPNGRLPLLSAWPAVTPANLKEGCYQFCCLVNRGTMGVNSLPKTVTRQRCDCNLNLGPSAPESSTLATRLPSHCAVSMQIRVYGLVSVCLSVPFARRTPLLWTW